MSSFQWPPQGSGSGGGIQSINADTSSAQIITGSATPGITVSTTSGTTVITQQVANTSENGYLSSTDWNAFNGKQAAGSYITALTGDIAASGPGSAAATLATVNSGPGSYTNASITVNGKGLVTAASSGTAPVTAISVVSTNGLAGSSSGGAAPAITLSTTINSPVLAGNGTAINAATTTGTGATVVLAAGPTMSNPVVGTQSQFNGSTLAASTSYVDTAVANAISGVNPAVAVQAATTDPANTSGLTYNNGASGIGATFTGSTNTAIVIDGFTFTAVGQRLLVKNDTQSPSGAFNGIYNVTQIQTAILPPILTRALDYDSPSDINNTGSIPVVNGTVNGTTSWLNTAQVVTVGTTPLVFVQFSANPSTILTNPMTTAGDMIYGGSSGTPTRLPVGTSGQVPISTGSSVAMGTLPGNSTALKAPVITVLSSTGSTTGYLFTISTSTTCAVGDTYTNNSNTYTVLAALSAQNGQVFFASGANAPLSSGTLTRATGSGTASVSFTSQVALASYTLPTSPPPLYLRVRLVGGGGGGGGGGNGGTGGSNGAGTFFGPLLISGTAGTGGANGGTSGSPGGSAGTASLRTGPTGLAQTGNTGAFGNSSNVGTAGGGSGGAGPFGGAGTNNVGAAANSGAGGGGGASNVGSAGGGGGGSGGFVDAIISGGTLTGLGSATVYAVGTGGGGGSAGVSSSAGTAGAAGIIEVTAYYQ